MLMATRVRGGRSWDLVDEQNSTTAHSVDEESTVRMIDCVCCR